jgi:hypothetical protein
MDVGSRVFRLIQLEGDWYWRLDIKNDDGLIGPFLSRDEAEKDARETLGIGRALMEQAGYPRFFRNSSGGRQRRALAHFFGFHPWALPPSPPR